MALWGRNDNVGSDGTVSLSGLTVTGSGTTFGNVGAAQTGDVIRFGLRDGSLSGVFFGDAVIVGIASTTQLTIGSTAGLADAGIANTAFYVSELPIYTVGDSSFSDLGDGESSYQEFASRASADASALGTKNIGVNHVGLNIVVDGFGQDALSNGGSNIIIAGVGTGIVATTDASALGFSTVFAVAPPGVTLGDTLTVNGVDILISGIGATSVSLGSTISAPVGSGDNVTFNSDRLVSLASTISVGIATGDTLSFVRLMGGYDRTVYGISTTSGYSESTGKYRTNGVGWVGVTTYMDCHGKLRVKSEVLVAASGIQTGTDGLLYQTNK